MLAVLEAWKAGKEIQHRGGSVDAWSDCCIKPPFQPSWDFYTTQYRVKPEPREPREFWICGDKRVLLSDPDCEDCIHVREVIAQ